MHKDSVLVHLASGIGNVIFATPLLIALSELDFEIDILLHADYPELEVLLKEWRILRRIINGHEGKLPRLDDYAVLIPAIPPFYFQQYGWILQDKRKLISRPNNILFYNNEQAYYLEFAYKLGYPRSRQPQSYLPVQLSTDIEIGSDCVVIAPGSKTGEMSKKRWPYFPQLAERFENVVILGTNDDLYDCNSKQYIFPKSARSFVGKLSLKETAEIIASAGVMVGNDSGLSHLAAAIGVETIIIFGPTPDNTLGFNMVNVNTIRSGFSCEPCWFSNRRFGKCDKQIDCLKNIAVNRIEELANSNLFKNEN